MRIPSFQYSHAIADKRENHPSAQVNSPNTSLQFKLENAVKENNIPLIKQYLKQGANPNLLQSLCNNTEARKWLTISRRKNLLYPPGASRAKDSKLDRSLQELDMDSAKKILKEKLGVKNKELEVKDMLGAWPKAVAEDLVDVQRALLMLGGHDTYISLRAQDEDGGPKDPNVIKVMKEIPNFSPKRDTPKNHNCLELEGKEMVVCRNFAMDQVSTQAENPLIKSDYRKYLDPQKLNNHLNPYDLYMKLDHIMKHATDTHLINGGKFGLFLADRFAAMENQGEKTRLMLLTTPTHVMSFGLRIKDKDGNKVYVAKFFDPNRTTSHTRSASNALKTFEFQDMRAYISYSLPGADGPAMAYTYPGHEDRSSLPAGVDADRKLARCHIKDDEIDATAFALMLDGGFAGDLRRLAGEVASRPEADRLALLTADCGNGTPGLRWALQHGHADTIKAFGELLEGVPDDKRADLLAARDAKGTPGLYMALHEGHADAIKAFGELLQLVPKDQRAELLAATESFAANKKDSAGLIAPELFAARKKDSGGTPGLLMAQQGHDEAVKAFDELLQRVSKDQPSEANLSELTAKAENAAQALEPAQSHSKAAEAQAKTVGPALSRSSGSANRRAHYQERNNSLTHNTELSSEQSAAVKQALRSDPSLQVKQALPTVPGSYNPTVRAREQGVRESISQLAMVNTSQSSHTVGGLHGENKRLIDDVAAGSTRRSEAGKAAGESITAPTSLSIPEPGADYRPAIENQRQSSAAVMEPSARPAIAWQK